MDDLTYSLRVLCLRNRDGSFTTQHDRLRVLTLISRQLREAGHREMRATSLKAKHIDVLLKRWQAEGLSAGTVKNRLAHVRWWAEKVGKAGVVPNDNAKLGIPERQFSTGENRAWTLDGKLDRIRDAYVRIILLLQETFGLRREEAIKFQPQYADRNAYLALKGSWTKGGRDREVPIITAIQRALLDQAHQLAGSGSLIPPAKNYIQQRYFYDGLCKEAGFRNPHGLRHQYAQARYEALTGWKAPKAGGPSAKQLTPVQRLQDLNARQIISAELGHGRVEITVVYLGR